MKNNPKKLRSGRFEAFAPKFKYVRDINSFTRKTDRVQKGAKLTLNEESQPSWSKRKGSKFPWTKPMKGYKRVFVGYGKWVSKGRAPRKKQGRAPISAPKSPMKRKFMKFPRTYGYGWDDT